MGINRDMNPTNLFESQAVIKVVGVGGAGCNAVNRMVESGVDGVEFLALNTDNQALEQSLADQRLPIGAILTRGLGTGGDPTLGAKAAQESERSIIDLLEGSDMVFITAGMGGGTGTGAAPIVAELAKRTGALTIAVVTRPFTFEGPKRKRSADAGLEEIRKHVDTLIVIPNDKLMEVAEKGTSLKESFKTADDVLRQGVQGISDIITRPGLINVDFADVRTVLKDAGVALMGMGSAVGERRARLAAEIAANSPMLETSIQGAKRILVNISAGLDFSLGEAQDAMEYIAQLSDSEDADIFMGQTLDPSMGDAVTITLLAAGMDMNRRREADPVVVSQTRTRQRESTSLPQEDIAPPAARRESPLQPIEIDEIQLDIPTFLRKQKLKGQ